MNPVMSIDQVLYIVKLECIPTYILEMHRCESYEWDNDALTVILGSLLGYLGYLPWHISRFFDMHVV